jgi:protein TonB
MKNQHKRTWIIGSMMVLLVIACSFAMNAQTPKSTKNGSVILNEIVQNKYKTTEVLIEDSATSDYNKVYAVTEKMPQFPGGEDSLINFIYKKIRLPETGAEGNGIPGKVIVRFIVTKSGSVTRVEVVRSLDPACDREAIRVIKILPDFIPGEHNGRKVAVYYTLAVSFNPDYYLSKLKKY